jgi:hypothetical protein
LSRHKTSSTTGVFIVNFYRIVTALTLFGVFISACGTPAATLVATTETPMAIAELPTETSLPTAAPIVARPTIDVGYENALSQRLLLSFGALKLAGTGFPLSPDQASQLLPLWQEAINLTQSATNVQDQVNTLLAQIESVLTPEQITAINAMRLTQVELQAWAQANGMATGSGGGQGQGSGQGGGSGMSPEARATKQAAQGQTAQPNGENGLSAAVETALIAYLQGLAQ